MAASRRGSRLWIILTLVLLVAVVGLAAALRQVTSTNDSHSASLEATAAVLRTVVGRQAQQIANLQGMTATPQASAYEGTGSHSYLAAFQIDRYGYVIYIDWTESNGFIREGHLLTGDNYEPKATKAYRLSGIDNAGTLGFTAQDATTTIPFTGKANGDGTVTITGLPWYVFKGFVGGTFTQTLHSATPQAYSTAVASLAATLR